MEGEAKLFNLDNFSPEIINEINKYIQFDSQTQSSFVSTCSFFYDVVQHRRLHKQLLKYVAQGKQDEAEKILKKYPEFLLEKGTITDNSGRIFKNVTVFEYVLWALDVRYMAPMMIHCLSQDIKGEEIRRKLFEQYKKIKEYGITYELASQIHWEKHFDFSPLITALQDHVNNYNLWNVSKRWNHWRTKVRHQQFLLPAHVAQHFCEPNLKLTDMGDFNSDIFVRTFTYYNHIHRQDCSWFESLSKSEEKFALIRGSIREGAAAWDGTSGGSIAAKIDLKALESISRRRIEVDFKYLEELLTESNSIEEELSL